MKMDGAKLQYWDRCYQQRMSWPILRCSDDNTLGEFVDSRQEIIFLNVATQAQGVKELIKKGLKRVMHMTGYDIVRSEPMPADYPLDFDDNHISILQKVRPRTMTSPERIYAVIEAVKYITRQRIPGSIVECGVWRGGSMMAAALALRNMQCTTRELYLFDTFAGMPKPNDLDVDFHGHSAMPVFRSTQRGEDSSDFCFASFSDVQEGMASTGYDQQLIHLIKGKVENTIPLQAPDRIALLRLDTDWYESTRHELEHLFPRLSCGGILIIDDYGYWKGAKKATDEFIAQYAPTLFLNRIDHTGRIAIKMY
jgi:O-methyltransferase